MKLFVDDLRPFPEGDDYICCREFEEAIWQLSIHDFDFVSLDYDLGYGPTGLDILVWMRNNNKVPKRINIHSSHIWGRREMKEFCLRNFPDTEVTMDYVR